MSYRQRSIGKIGDFLPTVSQENLEEDLSRIREAAKEYYARKAGTWKPKRDLDAERLEDESRIRREGFLSGLSMIESVRMMRYFSGPEKIIHRSIRPDFDMTALEERIRDTLAKKIDLIRRETPPDMIIDELPTSSPIPTFVEELKEYRHKFLYGEWVEPTDKIRAGKNPMAEHTIKAVKKSHAKRKFSKKSRHGIL